jgi:hypothetical protein
MDPATVGLITAALPFLTGLVKRLLRTDRIKAEKRRHNVNSIIPIFLGMLTAGVKTYLDTQDWTQGVLAGLASATVASKARDVVKGNLS